MGVVRDLKTFKRVCLALHDGFAARDFKRDIGIILRDLQQPLEAVLHVRRG